MASDSGERRLLQLGYQQELRRVLSHFSNFACAFSVGSILSGVTASFNIGYGHGGPAVMVWTWVVHSILGLSIICSNAEICSSLPTAGGMFSWSYHLGGSHRRFWCWMTGWLSLTGWVGGTASAAFACAYVISTMVLLANGGALGGASIFTDAQFLGILAAVLVAQGLINLLPTRALQVVNKASVAWNALGAVTVMALLPAVAQRHQSARFVFTSFQRDGVIVSDSYTVLLGFLFAVYSLSGTDAAVHIAEETKSADRGAPRSLIFSYCANATYGLAFVLAILFSMQDTSEDALLRGAAGGFVIAQIFYDAFASYGSLTGAIVALGIPCVATFLGGTSSMTVTSRILWAFARDGALPLSSTLRQVNSKTGCPANAVCISTALCLLISLPLLCNDTAFSACVSIAILGGATSFLIPIALKVLVPGHAFARGPVHLGCLSLPVNAFACIYLLFICGVAVLPTNFPITSQTLNYAPVTWAVVVLLASIAWLLPGRLGARSWFAGRLSNVGRASPVLTPAPSLKAGL